jgi:putative FmdB family regulatory protein
MPLFEFRCQNCGREFEALVRGGERTSCPGCDGTDLERLISLFAASSEGTRDAALQSARRTNAKTIRDQRIADHEYKVKHQH